jgi:hypothetical protein
MTQSCNGPPRLRDAVLILDGVRLRSLESTVTQENQLSRATLILSVVSCSLYVLFSLCISDLSFLPSDRLGRCTMEREEALISNLHRTVEKGHPRTSPQHL